MLPAEVAGMLGKPENAVRGLQFRALASLSRHLAATERRQTEQSGEKSNGKGMDTVTFERPQEGRTVVASRTVGQSAATLVFAIKILSAS